MDGTDGIDEPMSCISRPIKILYIIDHLGIGGAQRQLVELVEALPKEIFEVHVVSLSTEKTSLAAKIEEAGVSIECLSLSGALDLGCFFRLLRIIRRKRPVIVQSWLFSADLYGRLAAWLCGVPVIISSVRSVELDKPKHHVLADRALNHLTDAFIANAKVIEDILVVRERVARHKLHTIYNGVDLGTFNPALRDGAARRLIDVDGEAPLIGIVGRLSPVKDHETFLKAASLISRRVPKARYLIAGDGPLRFELARLAFNLGLGNSVRFLERPRDIAEVIAALDVLVVSSEYEGCCNAILEAMAMGKPVVATAVGGNPELVIDGETGFLVPPKSPKHIAEAIIRILEERSSATEMGLAARSRAESLFSMERMVTETVLLYEKLLGSLNV